MTDPVPLFPENEALMKQVRAAIAGSNGGDGMEPRIARLEADMDHVKRDIGELKSDVRDLKSEMTNVRERLTRVEVKVDHLPSKGYVVTVTMLGVALLTTVMAFQDRLQAFLGTAAG